MKKYYRLFVNEDVKAAYDEFVREYRYLEKTHKVSNALTILFQNATKALKHHHKYTHTTKFKFTSDEAANYQKLIDFFYMEDAIAENHATAFLLEKLKVKVQEYFGVTSKPAIMNKVEVLCDKTGFKKLREGNVWKVVSPQYFILRNEVSTEEQKPLIECDRPRVQRIFEAFLRNEINFAGAIEACNTKDEVKYLNLLARQHREGGIEK